MSDHLETLLTEVSPEAPSGVNLEYDPEFARMEKAAQGTPDQEFGSTHIEAEPPDWETVLEATKNLLLRTRDLRIAVYLAQAELVVNGLPGFRDALRVIAVYVDKFWETVFPQLDPDDDNDPTMRNNALLGLTNAGGVIRQLRETILLSSRSVGRFSWTDCAIAKGELPVPDGMEEPPTQVKIDAALQSCDLSQLRLLAQATEECLKNVAAIEIAFTDRLGVAYGPDLESLTKDLKNISKLLKGWLDQFPEPELDSEFETDETGSMIAVPSSGSDRGPARVQLASTAAFGIECREDAIEGLDKIIRWFERFEPSSPLPMLLRRAKRLSTMSFLEILRDISPEGVGQALLIGGAEDLAESQTNGSGPSGQNSANVTAVDDEY